MKLGITADIHITSNHDHPERMKALESIFEICKELSIDTLIIAGDLFDQSLQDYSDFENLCNKGKYKNIHLVIIPGNHDPQLTGKKIVGDHIHIFDQPKWIHLDDIHFFLLPYHPFKSMGEILQEHLQDKEKMNQWWALVGHGDWVQSSRKINSYEPGIYMPLTGRDVNLFNPDLVFLGHIHDHYQDGKVYYPGSPCPIDINETGYRYFYVFDTDNRKVESVRVQSEFLYFHMNLVVLPLDDESAYVKRQISERINSWNLDELDSSDVKLRVKVCGYSTDRNAIQKTIKESLRNYSLYDKPNLDQLLVANDEERNYISKMLLEQIDNYSWQNGLDEPDQSSVLLEAMHIIYGD